MKNKTMKIIDLLNKNDKPKKFKYKNYIWKQPNNMNIYVNEDNIDFETYLASVQICDLGRLFLEVLNDNVEIIEDKPNNIDKLDYKYKNMYGNISVHRHSEVDIIDKINELAKAVNYLLEKSDSNE